MSFKGKFQTRRYFGIADKDYHWSKRMSDPIPDRYWNILVRMGFTDQGTEPNPDDYPL